MMEASASGCIVNFAGEIMEMYRLLDSGFIELYNGSVKLNVILCTDDINGYRVSLT